MVDFFEVIENRRSIRSYSDEPVSIDMVNSIIKSAGKAPSAHNTQPWHFTVIKTFEIKNQLLKAMERKYIEDLCLDGISKEIIEERIRRSREIFIKAPVLIIPFLVNDRLKSFENDRLNHIEKILAIQSISAAIQQILLAATAKGLGSCWFSAPLHCQEVILEALNIVESWEPQALITLGYSEEKPREKNLREWKEIISIL